MTSHWRYRMTAPDYEEAQRELLSVSYLRMRETETYYAYMRRMELLIERAIEFRDNAREMWSRGRTESNRGILFPRDVPSSSTRPVRSAHYTLDPFRASTSRDPRFSPVFDRTTGSPVVPSPTPSPPVTSPHPYHSLYYTPGVPRADHVPRPLGLYAREPYIAERVDGFDTSPFRREFSTWGYTGISSDTSGYGISVGSGYRLGGSVEGLGGGQTGGAAETEVEVRAEIEDSIGECESVVGIGSGGESSSIQMWIPESPIVEVVIISSAEDAEVIEDEQVEDDSELMTETVTTRESSDDPDYTVGS